VLDRRGNVSIFIDVGADRAGADRVDANVIAGELQRRHFGEGDLTGLGRAVGREAESGKAAAAVDRARDDDAPAALFHVRNGIFDGQERAFQIGGQRVVPVFGRQFLNGRNFAVDAGVGEYDIQPPPRPHRRFHGSLHARGIGDVRIDGDRLRADALRRADAVDLLLHLLRAAVFQIDKAYVRPGFRQPDRGRAADAGAGARHHRHPVHQFLLRGRRRRSFQHGSHLASPPGLGFSFNMPGGRNCQSCQKKRANFRPRACLSRVPLAAAARVMILVRRPCTGGKCPGNPAGDRARENGIRAAAALPGAAANLP